jgi:hypothetical protein
MDPIVRTWLRMSRKELDDIFRSAKAGAIPTGEMRGTAIVTGTSFSYPLALVARALAWQGKVFDIFAPPDHGVLINKITPLSLSFIVAKVYRGGSWLDGNEAIVIDYSRTSFVAAKIRDEIREIQSGLYLGKVWWGRTRILDFALSRPQGS